MRYALGLTLALGLVLPAGAAAQALWDSPSFMAPGAPSGLTMALTDSDPGDQLGFIGIWRRAPAPVGVGFRAGISEAPGDNLRGLFGIDVSGSLASFEGAGNPAALWWTGAGVGVGDYFTASFPLGLVFGWTGSDESVSFMPYVGGHVVLDVITEGNDDLDLNAVVDLGVDVGFPSGWIARFGAGLGDHESLGIGFRIPTAGR